MADHPNVEQASWELARRIVEQVRATRDRRVQWTVAELGFASVAFEGSKRLAAGNDTLGHLLYFRLLAEIAIRLSWAARLAPDPGQTRTRIDALMRRDLMNLQRAAEKTSGGSNRDAAALLAELQNVKPATPKLEDLAQEGDAGGEYRYYRLASAMVHAGAGMRMLRRFPPDATQINAREGIIRCLSESSSLLGLLGVTDVPDDEIDALVVDGIFEISPTVWTVRLRRALARTGGSRGVRASVESIEMRQTEARFTLTASAVVVGTTGRHSIDASGPGYESVFAAILAQASPIR